MNLASKTSNVPRQPDSAPIAEVLALTDENPWPGAAAYDEASRAFFFGRVPEAKELFQLIRVASLSVVYGKSGLGKTSLLQAGLYPLLRPEHYLPVPIRIDFAEGSPLSPLGQAMRRLVEELDHGEADYTPPGTEESLWEYLHRSDVEIWSSDNFPLVPVLIFDQIEEVFSRSGGNAEQVNQIFDGLADLIENRIPAALTGEAARPIRSRLDLRSQRYRIVLSFREDFLPEIKAWEAKIPSLLRNCLRLEPMSRERAIDAVQRAGKAILDKDVAPYIVDFVGRLDRGPEAAAMSEFVIEPVLLSLCCYQLNRRRNGKLIDKALVDSAGQDILESFYREALADADVRGLPDVARFIEEYLIQGDHFRGDYPKREALDENLINAKQLAALTDRHRLLRIVHGSDTTRIELIHDRLVPVVRRARDQRRIRAHQEEQERLARQAEAERDAEHKRNEELQRQRDAANRSYKIARTSRNVAAALALISVGLLGWALLAKEEANRERIGSAVVLKTSRFGEGRLALDAGMEPLEQIMYRGLAGYRLSVSSKEMSGAGLASLATLHHALEATSHLRKAVTFGDLVPTPALSYSPDGKVLAVGGEDGDIRLLDAKSFRETLRLNCRQPSKEIAWSLAFNSDGSRLVAGYSASEGVGSGLVCVFDVREPKPEPVRRWATLDLSNEPGDIFSVAYGGTPGAEYIIAGGSDKTLRRFDFNTGVITALPQGTRVGAVAISPDLRKVATAGEDGVIRVWRLADFGDPRSRPVELKGHFATVQQVVFAPNDSSVLVSGGDDGRVMVWKAKNGDFSKGCRTQQSEAQRARIFVVAVAKDGLIAAAGWDGNVRLFRSLEGAPSCNEKTTKAAPSKAVTPDLSVIEDGVLQGHGGVVLGLAFDPEGLHLASTGQDGAIRIWGANTPGWSTAELQLQTADDVTTLAISSNGDSIAAGDRSGRIHLWSRPATNESISLKSTAEWSAHKTPINGLVYVKIGNKDVLVSGADDGLIKRWDPATHEPVGPDLAADAKAIRSIAALADRGLIATGSSDGTVHVWDLAKGKTIQVVERPVDAPENYELHAVAFTGDGKYVAIGSNLPALRVVALETGIPERMLQGPGDPIKALSHGESKWLLSAGEDGSVLEWEPSALTRTQPSRLKKQFRFRLGFAEPKELTSLDTTADGRLIVAGGVDGLIQLWDGREDVLVGNRFLGHRNQVIRAVAMAPDGSYFVTADRSRILVWPGPDRWAELVCSKLAWNMSDQQWRDWVSPNIHNLEQCPGLPKLE